jgi:hypothetical protein
VVTLRNNICASAPLGQGTAATANRFRFATGDFSNRTPVGDSHIVAKLLCICVYVKNVCRRQTEIVRNHEHANFGSIRHSEARSSEHKEFKIHAFKFTAIKLTKLALRHKLNAVKHDLLLKAWISRNFAYSANVCVIL